MRVRSSDRFQKPYPFQADIVVSVDSVFEQKLDAINELVSQAYEGGAGGSVEHVQAIPPASDPADRRAWLKARWSRRQSSVADEHRDLLIDLYGGERGRAVQFAEAFELCEYGRRPAPEELRKMFPLQD